MPVNPNAQAVRPVARNETIRLHVFDGFPVYVVKRHNWALLAWAQFSRAYGPLTLLSLDQHTDSMAPFVRHCWSAERTWDANEAGRTVELAKVDLSSDASVRLAVRKLNHDEQIKAATGLGVLKAAFVISRQAHADSPLSDEAMAHTEHFSIDRLLQSMTTDCPVPEMPPRPYHYQRDPDNVYLVGSECTPGCPKVPHDDDCYRSLCDSAISTVQLDSQLAVANEMATAALGWQSCLEYPYVLDLDLDYFRTRRAVAPPDPGRFRDLIRGAVGMTIATEPGCVRAGSLAGERLTSKWLLEQSLEHVRAARTRICEV